jgi:hypothetical protein
MPRIDLVAHGTTSDADTIKRHRDRPAAHRRRGAARSARSVPRHHRRLPPVSGAGSPATRSARSPRRRPPACSPTRAGRRLRRASAAGDGRCQRRDPDGDERRPRRRRGRGRGPRARPARTDPRQHERRRPDRRRRHARRNSPELAADPPAGPGSSPCKVAGAFHTAHMEPAVDGAACAAYAEASQPADPVGDAGVQPRRLRHRDRRRTDVLDRLVGQVANPVRWDLCMETLLAEASASPASSSWPPAGTLAVGLAKRAMRGVEGRRDARREDARTRPRRAPTKGRVAVRMLRSSTGRRRRHAVTADPRGDEVTR